jgi:glycosyltransferase involved in cell wall biosynthesis
MKEVGWEVDYLYWGNYHRADLNAMRAFFGENHFFFANISSLSFNNSFRGFIRRQFDKKGLTKYVSLPYNPDELFYMEVAEKAQLLHKRNNYDAIWIEYYLQSKLFDYFDDNTLKVIHTHDVFSNRQRIFQRDGKIPEFYYLTPHGERKALSRADVVIAVQDGEREVFKKLLEGTGTKCITVGNLIEKHDNKFICNNTYGFLGSINDANITAVNTYIKEILPMVKERIPNSKFVIAGGVCTKVPDGDDYIKLGYIDSLNDFYDQVSFVVTPMLAGTGLNIKNIEALSYGKPIITTGLGAKGLVGADKSIIVSSLENFADNVSLLLGNEKKLAEMGVAASQFVDEYNSKHESNYRMIEELARRKKN